MAIFFLFIAQGLVKTVGGQTVSETVGGRDGIGIGIHRQTLAMYGFGIAGVEAAHVITVVGIGLIAQIQTQAMTLAVVLVPALIPCRQCL